MNQIEIPIIASDLRQDEVCIRAIQTFEHLERVIDEVFDKIDTRIAANMTRIKNVNQRIDKASEKIEALKESKKAIKFYSLSKYPIDDPPIYTPTFCDEFKTKLNFSYNLNQGSLPVPDTNKYSDKLQFYHLKASHEDIKTKNEKLVFKVKSINSLIIFVNNENLIYNELSPKIRKKEILPFAHDEDDTTDFSRLSKVIKNKQDQENFHYFPNLSQAPELELPNDLPDLTGIADDISFSVSDQELIAPSLGKMNIINELPNVEELVAESSKKSHESISTSKTDEIPAPPAIPVNIPPPPPPIPIALSSPAAPPPPPVPPMLSDSGNAPKVSQPDDMRSNLMAAIRNAAGKTKLRSVPAADEQAPNAKKKPVIQPAGDLMSDLHAKLAMRRRGIAGTKEAKKEKASILDKVSSLIPPPKADDSDSSSDSASNNDTDWD